MKDLLMKKLLYYKNRIKKWIYFRAKIRIFNKKFRYKWNKNDILFFITK